MLQRIDYSIEFDIAERWWRRVRLDEDAFEAERECVILKPVEIEQLSTLVDPSNRQTIQLDNGVIVLDVFSGVVLKWTVDADVIMGTYFS